MANTTTVIKLDTGGYPAGPQVVVSMVRAINKKIQKNLKIEKDIKCHPTLIQ